MEKYQAVLEPLKVLTVIVVRARGVTVGLSDLVDIPDPYVILRLCNSPTPKQRTSTKKDDTSPEWNERFTFVLNSVRKNTLELVMKDEDIGRDDLIGKATVELDDLPMDIEIKQAIEIRKLKTFLEIKLRIEYDESKELRFSHDLCDEEKDFVTKRKEKVLKNMRKILSESEAPRQVEEVPTIAIIGSGGGYRAMCCLSGVFCALEETGILNCATYAAGLSGSSWYISTLYSNEGWPHNTTCVEVAKDLRKRFNTSIRSHFHRTYLTAMKEKEKTGQPVTLTDLVGMALGDGLLQNKQSKFSNQVVKLETARAPLPLCTAIRVRKTISAEIFSEWMEFSPFEFGMAKYGVFGKMKDFGAKFYKGRRVKKFEEPPLHYLIGIWGSAFSILLNRIVGDDSGKKPRRASRKLAKEKFIKEEIDQSEKAEEENSADEDEEHKTLWFKPVLDQTSVFESMLGRGHKQKNKQRNQKKGEAKGKECQKRMDDGKADECDDEDEKDGRTGPEDEIITKFWVKEILRPKKLLNSRQGKAAEVLNMYRGLVFKSRKDGILQSRSPGSTKTMCLVDSGLAFNSPYPAVLREKRKAEIILSFDFSQRDEGDDSLLFEELLKAEKWAKDNSIPFPPIADNPVTKEGGIRECYVFENPDDPRCPTILHFALVNKTFKDYVTPGVPRTTAAEKNFGNFKIFDDPDNRFSTFSFQYDNKSFDRLHELMRFNTLLNLDLIKEKIACHVHYRQNNQETKL